MGQAQCVGIGRDSGQIIERCYVSSYLIELHRELGRLNVLPVYHSSGSALVAVQQAGAKQDTEEPTEPGSEGPRPASRVVGQAKGISSQVFQVLMLIFL